MGVLYGTYLFLITIGLAIILKFSCFLIAKRLRKRTQPVILNLMTKLHTRRRSQVVILLSGLILFWVVSFYFSIAYLQLFSLMISSFSLVVILFPLLSLRLPVLSDSRKSSLANELLYYASTALTVILFISAILFYFMLYSYFQVGLYLLVVLLLSSCFLVVFLLETLNHIRLEYAKETGPFSETVIGILLCGCYNALKKAALKMTQLFNPITLYQTMTIQMAFKRIIWFPLVASIILAMVWGIYSGIMISSTFIIEFCFSLLWLLISLGVLKLVNLKKNWLTILVTISYGGYLYFHSLICYLLFTSERVEPERLEVTEVGRKLLMYESFERKAFFIINVLSIGLIFGLLVFILYQQFAKSSRVEEIG